MKPRKTTRRREEADRRLLSLRRVEHLNIYIYHFYISSHYLIIYNQTFYYLIIILILFVLKIFKNCAAAPNFFLPHSSLLTTRLSYLHVCLISASIIACHVRVIVAPQTGGREQRFTMPENTESPSAAQPLLHPSSSARPSSPNSEPSDSGAGEARGKASLLAVGCAVLLLQWIATSIFSPFFPKSPQAAEASRPVKGVIFSAFDLGVVLAGPMVERFLTTHSGSSVALGVLLMGSFSLCFGLTPLFVAAGTARWVLFFTFHFLAGGTSTFAAVGVYTLLAQGFPESRGHSVSHTIPLMTN